MDAIFDLYGEVVAGLFLGYARAAGARNLLEAVEWVKAATVGAFGEFPQARQTYMSRGMFGVVCEQIDRVAGGGVDPGPKPWED